MKDKEKEWSKSFEKEGKDKVKEWLKDKEKEWLGSKSKYFFLVVFELLCDGEYEKGIINYRIYLVCVVL